MAERRLPSTDNFRVKASQCCCLFSLEVHVAIITIKTANKIPLKNKVRLPFCFLVIPSIDGGIYFVISLFVADEKTQ